ncbi:14680_t:CDS:2 [Dentiscutata heterogama]|uniref:14680_t:CDS:1 n=1 Tax=Dentiscutata heterogama TaxID=1316150 RepID=A0ACA9KXQ3_9GLOM|nr:14680_t:CDS:2 [Dentiscutata heterogama]
MVTANDTQEESDRNSSILMDIIPVKAIILLSNYGKNIPIDTKNSAYKRCLTKHEETNMSTNKELKTSQKIQAYIQRRAEQIINEQMKMLTSLLEWPFHKVVLDRVLVQNQDQKTLLNNPVEVLEEVQAHF